MSRPATALSLALPLVVWDLDLSDGGFVPGGTPGQWEWGTPTTGPVGEGRMWATELDRDYLNNASDTLQIPVGDLSSLAEPSLVIVHWYDVRSGDGGVLEVDDGAGWERLDPVYGYPDPVGFSGTSNGFVRSTFDLTPIGPTPAVRLHFTSDAAGKAAGWYVRQVELYDGDAAPPHLVALEVPGDTQDVHGTYRVRLLAFDDHVVPSVTVTATFGDGPPTDFPAVGAGGGQWTVDLPSQPPGTVVGWHATATDGVEDARLPDVGELSFRVFLPAPTGLQAEDARAVGESVRLVWDPPATAEPVIGYRIVQDGLVDLPIDVATASAEVPVLETGAHTWQVAARFDAGIGDWSDPFALFVEVPELVAVTPDRAWAGDRLRIELGGESLYLGGDAAVSLGDGVTVETVDLLDANSVRAVVALADDAAPGPRDVTLTSVFGEWTFPASFSVGDPADRPQIVRVEPASVVQGFEGEVEFEATEPFAGPVDFAVDEDLLFSRATTSGTLAHATLHVGGGAGTGTHLVVLDDGVRLWPSQIEVTERVVDTQHTCDHTSRTGGLAALLALAAARWRRRTR